ncbi:MAG: SAM-dependent methyltransferase [Ruminococcus sp.]|nr:SAM-dependent methyltransferase [Ruminococcus sp.]
MQEIQKLWKETLNESFVQAVLSNPRTKEGILKIKVRPVERKGRLLFQCESFTKTQAFHENLDAAGAALRLEKEMENFRQLQMSVRGMEITVLVSKKGKITIRKHRQEGQVQEINRSHNRSKKYILKEGVPVPFLQDLGVMTADGRVVRTKFDKFRQINRFLEFMEDVLPRLEKGREITILDFGCGKSYLTFAMYYYLHELKQYDIRMIGLDLKEDVIAHCSTLAEKYGYEKLQFLTGDIAAYEGVSAVDMVVTLHACDTATDYALAKAIGWNAKVILSVPCCQHELNTQIRNDILSPITEYGLLKERFAALVTDGLRAKYLEYAGYDTQVLEFIDMEHTPKNILLRGIRREDKSGREKDGKKEQMQKQIRSCEAFLGVMPTLGDLLKKIEES